MQGYRQSEDFDSAAGANPVVVIGAGFGGLAATLELALAQVPVVLVDAASGPGGKARRICLAGRELGTGPTVLTMRWLFEELFARCGAELGDIVPAQPLPVLARHYWSAEESLDLFADPERSQRAVSAFSGPAEARRFEQFMQRSAQLYEALDRSYLRAGRPGSAWSLCRGMGAAGTWALLRSTGLRTLWSQLGRHFRDPRLRQLFGRYATYCGSSPFAAPATLTLIAHVERLGVWVPKGGLNGLAGALAALAARLGAQLRFGARVTRIETRDDRVSTLTFADGRHIAPRAVIFNGEPDALVGGLLGADVRAATAAAGPDSRSLSAVTWNLVGEAHGAALDHHNVFFARSSAEEFHSLFADQRPPADPTVYLCAQDRESGACAAEEGPEALFCLVNAPALSPHRAWGQPEITQCQSAMMQTLARCGLNLRWRPDHGVVNTPADFAARFPGSQGALYGRSTHGWQASFARPQSRTRIQNLYLAGGSVHPGAGIPMATLSGRQAALSLVADWASSRRWHPTATAGGTSMSSATMADSG